MSRSIEVKRLNTTRDEYKVKLTVMYFENSKTYRACVHIVKSDGRFELYEPLSKWNRNVTLEKVARYNANRLRHWADVVDNHVKGGYAHEELRLAIVNALAGEPEVRL